MNKTTLVMRYDMAATLRSRSFLLMALIVPVAAVLAFLIASLLQERAAGSTPVATETGSMVELKREGYVDLAGVIRTIPDEVPPDTLVAFADESAARQALSRGEIVGYYVVAADYVVSGDLTYINPDYRIVAFFDQFWTIQHTLQVNLLGDQNRRARVLPPMDLEVLPLAPAEPSIEWGSGISFYFPYAVMMLFYFVLMMAGSTLLNSVANEKKNRTMEVLLVSVSPRQLLAGKILALGSLGLLQAVLWMATGYGLLRLAGRPFSIPPSMMPPVSVLAWGLLFFLLGYAVYASLMAGLGALAPNTREASQVVLVVIWPLLIPLFFIRAILEHTHQALSVGLSLFPFTAPLAMMARIAIGGVPWWQPVLAALLLLATAWLVVRAVAKLFEAQMILSGQPLTTRRFLRALLGRPVEPSSV